MIKLLFSASVINILVMGLNFLFKIFLSYKFSKEDLGVFYTFIDLISVGIMFFGGFKDSLIKAFDEMDYKGVIYWYVLGFWGLFGLVFLGEIFYFYVSGIEYSIIYFVLFFVLNAFMVFFSYLNAAFKVYKVMLFEGLVMSLGVISGYFIFNNFFSGIKVLFFSFLFSYLARISFILLFSNIKLNIKKVEFNKVKQFFKNTILSSLMYFFSGLFISVASLIILKVFNDKDFLAEYQVVIRSLFFSLVAIFVFPINTFTFPEISKLISNKKFDEVRRIESKFLKYLVVFLIIILFSMFFTKYIISFVFPKEYKEAYIYVNVMLPFLPFIAYTTFALNILKGFNRFELSLYVRIIGSLSFFVGILLFYSFGAKSIVYAMDFAFLTMALMAYYFKRKLL
ncbi:MAG: hypothetical protein ABGX26_02975 [Nautiliaceae bacterium]